MLVFLLLRSFVIWFPLLSLVWSTSYDPNAVWVLELRCAGSTAKDGTTTRAQAPGLARPWGHPVLSLGCAHTAPALDHHPHQGPAPSGSLPLAGPRWAPRRGPRGTETSPGERTARDRDEPRGEDRAGPRRAPGRGPKPYSPWDGIGWQPKWLF